MIATRSETRGGVGGSGGYAIFKDMWRGFWYNVGHKVNMEKTMVGIAAVAMGIVAYGDGKCADTVACGTIRKAEILRKPDAATRAAIVQAK